VLAAKLGLSDAPEAGFALANDLLRLMAAGQVDFTLCFRRLFEAARTGNDATFAELFADKPAIANWLAGWRAVFANASIDMATRCEIMRTANPAFIPRNHRVEEMIEAAIDGDMQPFERLRTVLTRPYDDQPEHADLAELPGAEQWDYCTFCGT
jgi:uncharacterized protein YdiU (UPF0061 family)